MFHCESVRQLCLKRQHVLKEKLRFKGNYNTLGLLFEFMCSTLFLKLQADQSFPESLLKPEESAKTTPAHQYGYELQNHHFRLTGTTLPTSTLFYECA